jgi:hypothetical protein
MIFLVLIVGIMMASWIFGDIWISDVRAFLRGLIK